MIAKEQTIHRFWRGGRTGLVVLLFLLFVFTSGRSENANLERVVESSSGQSTGASSEPVSEPLLNSKIREAVRHGRSYLASKQLNSGQFHDRYPVAITSLACLALMAGGSTSSRGPYRNEIQKGLEYIFSRAGGQRVFLTGSGGRGRMHGHGFALLFLSEVYGNMPDEYTSRGKELRSIIEKAVEVTRYAQTRLGGWGYKPNPEKGDEASVTITQIQALRAARNAGIKVESSTIEKAIEYVRKCHGGNGRFKYSLSRGSSRYSFALTAAAVSTLNYSGLYSSMASDEHEKEVQAMIQAGLNYMQNNMVKNPDDRWFFYGHFYAAQAFYFAGGDAWVDYYRNISRRLLDVQKRDGSWKGRISPEYSTALALLILQVPYKHLPIFQK